MNFYVRQALERIPANLRGSMSYLRTLVDNPDAKMRFSLALALRLDRHSANEAIPILIKLLRDPDKSVVIEALSGIAG